MAVFQRLSEFVARSVSSKVKRNPATKDTRSKGGNSASTSTESPTKESVAENADWEVVDLRDGKLFLAGPTVDDVERLTVEGVGKCRRLEDISELLQSVNLIDDPAFRTSKTHWRTSFKGFENVAISAVDDKQSSLAPADGRALKVSISFGEEAESGRIFLIYSDPDLGKNIPVIEGEHCQLSCRLLVDENLKDKLASIRVSLEFHDQQGALLITETKEYLSDADELSVDHTESIKIHAVAPQKAKTMLFVVRVAARNVETGTGKLAFAISEPMLVRGDANSQATFTTAPKDLNPFRRAIVDPNRTVYIAETDLRSEFQPLSKIILWADGQNLPLLEHEVPSQTGSPVAQVFAIETPTLKIKVREFVGRISLRIDGETIETKSVRSFSTFRTVMFTAPSRFLDGDYHLIEVFDFQTDKLMARDYSLIADHNTQWTAIETYCENPFERRISPRANEWMRSYESQLEFFSTLENLAEQDLWLLKNLPRIRDVIVAGFQNNRDVFPLHFDQPNEPTVSVIIPVHNKYEVTFHCLCSLLMGRNDIDFEVVVVDDGSSDATIERLREHGGITVVRRESAGGFIDACHDGAKHASGKYLLFLNNDVETTAHWIDELVRVFEIFPGTGAAASKLLFPDGRLQDAGGLVWNNGSPANYGRGKNPLDPRYTYSRDADYLTGAALITPAEVWNEIGGFASELKPAYFEDTWYSFAVRELGLRTIYCAPSKVYHVQGVSNGVDADTSTGLKRFQNINHPKFKKRWARTYAAHGDEWDQEDLQKDRRASGRALVISWTLARPDHDAGSFALLQEMKMLQSLGMKVTHLPGNCSYMGRYNEDLYRQGIECIHMPFASSVEDFLIQRGTEFDMVYVCDYATLAPIIDPIRKHAPQAKLVLNIMDLHFLREMRRSLALGDTKSEESAHHIREAEIDTIKLTDMTVSYSDLEVEMMRALIGSAAKVDLLPWVQETVPETTPLEERSGLCFVGSYRHPPNAEAVDYFAESILPKLNSGNGENTLHVYGSGWDSNADAHSADGIQIDGFIEDLADAYAGHRIFVGPLTSGAGIKGKVISAMAHGIPTVLSDIAAESMAIRHMEHCLIANSPQEWVEAIAMLQTDQQLWQKIRANALDFVESNFSHDLGTEQMRKIMNSVDIFV